MRKVKCGTCGKKFGKGAGIATHKIRVHRGGGTWSTKPKRACSRGAAVVSASQEVKSQNGELREGVLNLVNRVEGLRERADELRKQADEIEKKIRALLVDEISEEVASLL